MQWDNFYKLGKLFVTNFIILYKNILYTRILFITYNSSSKSIFPIFHWHDQFVNKQGRRSLLDDKKMWLGRVMSGQKPRYFFFSLLEPSLDRYIHITWFVPIARKWRLVARNPPRFRLFENPAWRLSRRSMSSRGNVYRYGRGDASRDSIDSVSYTRV